MDVPKPPVGKVHVLSQADEPPMKLMHLENGEMQPVLGNDLFNAPLYPQTMRWEDFLLIRTKLTPMTFVLREVPAGRYVCAFSLCVYFCNLLFQ